MPKWQADRDWQSSLPDTSCSWRTTWIPKLSLLHWVSSSGLLWLDRRTRVAQTARWGQCCSCQWKNFNDWGIWHGGNGGERHLKYTLCNWNLWTYDLPIFHQIFELNPENLTWDIVSSKRDIVIEHRSTYFCTIIHNQIKMALYCPRAVVHSVSS